ncbi:Nn.00g094720.m01.CDS01 [Neocucurbitaria sp. VM-36]
MSSSTPISIPNHTIQTLASADIRTLAAFVQASKLQLAINQFLFKDWPNEKAQQKHNLQAVTANFDNQNVARFKVTKKEKKDEKPAISAKHERPRMPNAMNPEVFTAVMQAIKYINEEVQGTDRNELTHIYVAPSSRGKGIGSHLVHLAAQPAQEEHSPLTMAAEPQAHCFFLKQGLLDTRHFDIDLSRWAAEYCGFGVFRLWGMRLRQEFVIAGALLLARSIVDVSALGLAAGGSLPDFQDQIYATWL